MSTLTSCAWIATLIALLAARPAAADALVDSTNPALPAARAHLGPGDRLERVAAAGQRASAPVRDPFDALVAEFEIADVAPALLTIRRGHQSMSLRLDADAWGVQWLPALTEAQRGLYSKDIAPLERTNPAAYCMEIGKLAGHLPADLGRGAGWMQWRCAQAAAEKREWELSDAAFAKAFETVKSDPRAAGALQLLRARQALAAQSWDRASGAADAAAKAAGTLPPNSPLGLRIAEIGPRIDLFRSRFAQAAAGYESVLARVREQTPGSLIEASLLNGLGAALRDLGRRGEADAAFGRGLAIRARLAPVGLETASLHNNYSGLLYESESSRALAESRAAVEMYRKVAPESVALAAAINNLGNRYRSRGDLVAAEAWHREALALREKIAPDSYDVAASLGNLAAIAVDRGEFDDAKVLNDRSTRLLENTMPRTQILGVTYFRTGIIELHRGNLAASAAAYLAARAIFEKVAPEGMWYANALVGQGRVNARRGDLKEAKSGFEAAIAMMETSSGGTGAEAEARIYLGEVDARLGNLESAERQLRLAMDYYDHAGPEVIEASITRHQLSNVLLRMGRLQEAHAAACAAEQRLDAARPVMSLSRESQSEYAARFADIPRACAAALIDSGKVAEAFDVIERGRARALREHLSFGESRLAEALLPESLRDRGADLFVRRARLEALSATAPDPAGTATAQIHSALIELHDSEESWLADVARAAPRYAQAIRGAPWTQQEILRSLPATTAIVAFVVGEERTDVLVLSGADRKMHSRTLRLGRAALARDADALQEALRGAVPPAALEQMLAAFYQRWFGDFDAELLKAERLLIVPDAALDGIPFAALRRAGQYLVQRWAIAVSPSVTVAMRNLPANPAPSVLVVANTAARSVEDGGGARLALPALPAAAAEAAAVASEYGTDAIALVDSQASESAVREHAGSATLLHFATHAYVDGKNPLQSGLVLDPDATAKASDERDGIAHAWEIMANWRLEPAELVILSACDTGRGRELSDEGVIGLARAFQFAGAHAVIASLWPVADRSTAELMKRLHASLASRQGAASALRLAQLAAIDSKQGDSAGVVRGTGKLVTRDDSSLPRSHPYAWAAFEVFGQLP
jgi:CHAT domain-containing protein/Tfp pilus assembly protein PilF